MKKYKNKIRSAAIIAAKKRKAGAHKPKKNKRANGKNKQQEILKEKEE